MQFLRQIVKLALFHVLRNMCVDIHGGVKVGVTKDLLNDLDIDAVLKQAGCESVPIGYNKDKSGIALFARVSGFVLILFPLKMPRFQGL